MRISDKVAQFSKKGIEQKKFIEQRMNIKITRQDGKEEIWEYTINELVNEFTYLKTNMTMVSIFTKMMAQAFYEACPDHKFFKDCDKKLLDSLQLTKEKNEIEISIKSIEDAIKNTIPFPGGGQTILEKGK